MTNYLAAGGKLFVSGAEIGWDLDNLGNGVSFYNNQLKANYVSDDANTYNVQGANGSIFAGLSFSFDDGSQYYDAEYPDRISPLGGAITALNYVGGSGGGAAVQFDGGATKLVNFGFPFETITTEANRATVMDRVLEFFGVDIEPTADFDQNGSVNGGDVLGWQVGFGKPAGVQLADGDANSDGMVNDLDLEIWESQYGQSFSPVAALATESDPALVGPVSFASSALNPLNSLVDWPLENWGTSSRLSGDEAQITRREDYVLGEAFGTYQVESPFFAPSTPLDESSPTVTPPVLAADNLTEVDWLDEEWQLMNRGVEQWFQDL